MTQQFNNKPYTDNDGNIYESKEAFYNSPHLDSYSVMLYLHAGTRKPQDNFERHLLKEMQDIEASGGQIDSTENIW